MSVQTGMYIPKHFAIPVFYTRWYDDKWADFVRLGVGYKTPLSRWS
ncbi:MAG: hypothetical protein HYS17_01560 [Micavibrio aeruginosavorus]|uniref:Uncharacterized protein n=1 Tax=Micavibrio aeruginosavorus TaxID=349221 RepID=A0A7T5R2Z7_9BACT|nr:MAG: hypothetical protein HYS17_01560 [Micavibrio aeruginosavorus]